MTAETTIALQLDPLDVLFFRDGKPFEAGIRAASIEPLPQTLAGALRTHVLAHAGCDFARLATSVRQKASFAQALADQSTELGALAALACAGPWFAHRGEPVLPMPASLHRVGKKQQDGKFVPLTPLENAPPGWSGPLPRPLWTHQGGRTERATGWLTLAGMAKFLRGEVPSPTDALTRDMLFATDSRTGIVIGADTWTTEESLIYAADYLVLADNVALYAEITGPRAALETAFPQTGALSLPLGGQGRRVRVTRRDRAAWPPRPAANNARRLLLLTSPGLFAQGWKPAGLAPVAAAVPGHVAFSGWDLARNGPKSTRFAAVAGSVYFFDKPPAPHGASLCDDAEDRLLGWGSYLEGIWK
jgi:CRISPR-associated protein Cmr3